MSCSKYLAYMFLALCISVCAPFTLSSPFTNKQPAAVFQLRRKNTSAALPPYMIDLYKQLKEDRLISHGTSNTIRSFPSFPGALGRREILVFNVTAVNPSEYVERVDLHLQWKRQLQWKKKAFRLSILNLSQQAKAEMVAVVRRSAWGSWHTLDVTDAVISCLEGEEEVRRQRLVGLLVEEEEGGSEEKSSFSDVVANCFLAVFSEDDENLDIEKIGERNFTHPLQSARYRDRREVVGNELPDYPLENGHGSRLEIQARLKYRPLETSADDDSHHRVEKQSKKTKRKRRKTRRLQLKWRKSWWKPPEKNEAEGDFSLSEEQVEEERNASLCHRESMIVDFTKIGWSNWIIAPKKFDAYVCSGDCSFPLEKVSQQSNYASLREMLAKRSDQFINSGGLCCVPNTFSFVPLLFYDENRNVVLKKFPDMKVQSCICR